MTFSASVEVNYTTKRGECQIKMTIAAKLWLIGYRNRRVLNIALRNWIENSANAATRQLRLRARAPNPWRILRQAFCRQPEHSLSG